MKIFIQENKYCDVFVARYEASAGDWIYWTLTNLKQRINEALENKKYCSTAFVDISQAFDKVWHTGLLYKLRRSLPLNYFRIL
jgi:hypothetical protein